MSGYLSHAVAHNRSGTALQQICNIKRIVGYLLHTCVLAAADPTKVRCVPWAERGGEGCFGM